MKWLNILLGCATLLLLTFMLFFVLDFVSAFSAVTIGYYNALLAHLAFMIVFLSLGLATILTYFAKPGRACVPALLLTLYTLLMIFHLPARNARLHYRTFLLNPTSEEIAWIDRKPVFSETVKKEDRTRMALILLSLSAYTAVLWLLRRRQPISGIHNGQDTVSHDRDITPDSISEL